jgi:hypothetical protein
VTGDFGVFDGLELVAEFDNDVDAEEYRAELLQLNLPEYVRRPLYDELWVGEVPTGYRDLLRLYLGLRRSRVQDLVIARALKTLEDAQRKRAEAVHCAAA